MKMEQFNLTLEEERVLLLFEPDMSSSGDTEVFEYLRAHDLEPRRQYHEQRDGKDYLVYYFGHCYLEPHLSALRAMATEANR